MFRYKDNCVWLPQIIDRDKITNKTLLINRLKTLDKLTNKDSEDYTSWTIFATNSKITKIWFISKR